MKRLVCLFICIVTLLSFAGCKKADEITIDKGEESAIVVGSDFDVTMEIVEGSVTSESARICVKNNTGIQINSGNERDFSLEVFENGKWYTIKTGIRSNTQEAYIFDSLRYLDIDWSDIYGTLPKGHYRLVKSFFPWSSDGTYSYKDEFYLTAEFDI